MDWSRIARRIRVPLGFLLAAVYLWLAQPTWGSILAGMAFAIFGLGIRAAAAGHVKKDREVTMTGPYAYTRNPLYLGSIILAVGFAVAARSPWIAALLLVMFAAIYIPTIRNEEAYLRSTFPSYQEYAQRVPRLIPRVGRGAQHPEEGGFSRELYLRHREYNALMGAAAMLAALVAKLLWLSR